MLFDKYAKKQTAQWLGSINTKHNSSYIPDMGKAMYLLGQNPASGNQIWHLPTTPPIVEKELIELSAGIFQTKPKYMQINKFMLQLFGLFDKPSAGIVEMYYQYDHDYNFNSDKFEKAFDYEPASYEAGIKAMAETLYKGVV